MKKKILTVLLALTSVLMLSSCIILDWEDWCDDWCDYEGDYKITIYNDSSYTLKDWYVVDSDGCKFYPKNRSVSRNCSSTIGYLDSGYYEIYFKLGSYDYESTGFFRVNRNRTYNVTNFKDHDYLTNIKQIENVD